MPYKDLEKRRAHKRARYKVHRLERIAYQRIYRKTHPEKVKASNEASLKRYRDKHKEQRKQSIQLWRLRNKGHISEYGKAYRQVNRLKERAKKQLRRVRIRGNVTGFVNFQYICERDKMLCCICGKKVARRDLSFDHVIPLSQGGPHCSWNIRVAHLICNIRKGAGRLPSQPYLLD